MVTSPKSDRCWLPSHAQGVLFLLTLRWPLCGCGRNTAPLASFFLLPPQPRVWGGRGTAHWAGHRAGARRVYMILFCTFGLRSGLV